MNVLVVLNTLPAPLLYRGQRVGEKKRKRREGEKREKGEEKRER